MVTGNPFQRVLVSGDAVTYIVLYLMFASSNMLSIYRLTCIHTELTYSQKQIPSPLTGIEPDTTGETVAKVVGLQEPLLIISELDEN